MEIFQELLLTVVFSLVLAFLIAKLVSASSAGNVEQEMVVISEKKEKEIIDEFVDKKVVTEERSFAGELKNTGLKIEKGFEFVEEPLIVDQIEGDLVTEGSSEILHGCGEEVFNEGSELVEIEHKEEGREEKVEEEQAEEEEEEVKNVGVEENPLKESCYKEEEEIKVGKFHEDCGLEENLVVEKVEKVEVHQEIGVESAEKEQILSHDEQIEVDDENEINQEIVIGVEKIGTDFLFSDDDWEGIERSEIENIFGAASIFVSSGDNNEQLSKLGSDVQMQLYGLHKVATEGPCYEPQPLALMVSSRAKWHAWQRLGNMSPEVAMEQYTALLSESVPGWMGTNPEGEIKHDISNDSLEAEVSGIKDHNLSSFLHHQPVSEDERKPGNHPLVEGDDGTGGIKKL